MALLRRFTEGGNRSLHLQRSARSMSELGPGIVSVTLRFWACFYVRPEESRDLLIRSCERLIVGSPNRTRTQGQAVLCLPRCPPLPAPAPGFQSTARSFAWLHSSRACPSPQALLTPKALDSRGEPGQAPHLGLQEAPLPIVCLPPAVAPVVSKAADRRAVS